MLLFSKYFSYFLLQLQHHSTMNQKNGICHCSDHSLLRNTASVLTLRLQGWSFQSVGPHIQCLDNCWIDCHDFFFIFIHGAQGMNPFVFCDPLTYHLVLPSCQIFHLSSEIFQHQQYGLAQNLTFIHLNFSPP